MNIRGNSINRGHVENTSSTANVKTSAGHLAITGRIMTLDLGVGRHPLWWVFKKGNATLGWPPPARWEVSLTLACILNSNAHTHTHTHTHTGEADLLHRASTTTCSFVLWGVVAEDQEAMLWPSTGSRSDNWNGKTNSILGRPRQNYLASAEKVTVKDKHFPFVTFDKSRDVAHHATDSQTRD